MRRKLVVGNWKMHGSHKGNAELLAGIVGARPFGCDVAVCVPFPTCRRRP
jgi:triosephosphate isomerase